MLDSPVIWCQWYWCWWWCYWLWQSVVDLPINSFNFSHHRAFCSGQLKYGMCQWAHQWNHRQHHLQHHHQQQQQECMYGFHRHLLLLQRLDRQSNEKYYHKFGNLISKYDRICEKCASLKVKDFPQDTLPTVSHYTDLFPPKLLFRHQKTL